MIHLTDEMRGVRERARDEMIYSQENVMCQGHGEKGPRTGIDLAVEITVLGTLAEIKVQATRVTMCADCT